MRTIDKALTSLSPLPLLGVLAAIDIAMVLVGWVLYGLPTWPDITPSRILNLLTGEPLIRIVGDEISISNSLITMWIVMAILILLAYAGTRRLALIPGGLQGGLEVAVQTLVDFVVDTGGPAAAKYVPLVGTLFLFILLSNWLGVVPLVGQIPLLHAPTADYHITLGLAIVAFVGYQAEGIRTLGRGYFKRWLNLESFKEGPFLGGLLIFVGFIEFLAEVIRILTLTARLWGNVFGGEVMLVVMAAVLYVVAIPILLPFAGFEMFIGLLQAVIFSILTLLYFVLATESHEAHGESDENHATTTKEESHA
ncbi:MAG: F0F1 ATP synthase subunit A [Chloroflexi bacterium]|nr:MAG: F0F1 ATP synthase subunit A [Chloroflexota bacterium]